MEKNCLLCGNTGSLFFDSANQTIYECITCKGIYVPSSLLPEAEEEIERYLTHKNDIEDLNYQKFVSPIVYAVLKDFKAEEHSGLDYGAGTGPVITKMLQDMNFQISPYDPFFRNDKKLLKQQYDFIVCCEVMEHFHHPAKEFGRLKKLLLPGGKLYCMTHLYTPETNFNTWYYKNDPTHVFIYQKETLRYIADTEGFSGFTTDKRLIIFST